MENIVYKRDPETGICYLENYESYKQELTEFVNQYKGKTYTDPDEAAKDRTVLESYKEQLQDVLGKIKEPYVEIEKQIESLLKIIQEPISAINRYEKLLREEERKKELMAIAEECGEVLGEYKYFVINSPAFIEAAWLRGTFTSYNKRKSAIQEKIARISNDIHTIAQIGGEHRKALLANYYETLRLDNVDRFIDALNSKDAETAKVNNSGAAGYKVIKIYGTREDLEQVYHSLDILGVEFEELEDGLPGAPKEVFEPVFDSFVAFDTENSGTYGGKDLPAALTEIGAVKVINGQIVDNKDWLINPQREIVPRIARMTRITNDMVKDEPTINTVIKEFKEFVGDLPFVGHNIKAADLRFILKDGEKNGIAFQNEFFDTNKYAKKIKDNYGFEDTKLEYLAGYFGIKDEGHHRADNDAKVNAEVYLKLKNLDDRS